jgi:hypothetical protein
MLYRGKMIPINADQVVDVRQAIGENQVDFGMRFGRSRFSIIRWEQNGTKFSYQSGRWLMWQNAVSESIHQATIRDDNDSAENLRKLRTLPN